MMLVWLCVINIMTELKSNDSRFVLRRLYYSPSFNCRAVLARNETIQIPTHVQITCKGRHPKLETKFTEPTPRASPKSAKGFRRIKIEGRSYVDDEGQMRGSAVWNLTNRTHYFARPSKFFHNSSKKKDQENDPPAAEQPVAAVKRRNDCSKPSRNILSSSSCYMNQFLANKIKAITVSRKNNYYSYLLKCAKDTDSSREI